MKNLKNLLATITLFSIMMLGTFSANAGGAKFKGDNPTPCTSDGGVIITGLAGGVIITGLAGGVIITGLAGGVIITGLVAPRTPCGVIITG